MRRDDPDVFQVGPAPTLPAPPARVIELLAPLVTPARLERIRRVAAARTRAIVPVLDGLTDPHNVSAVLRSAEAFGVQEVHAIEGPNGFAAAERVAKGTHRWLDVLRYRAAEPCIRALRARGYRILVARAGGQRTPADLAALAPVAVVFGNEHAGVSLEVEAASDGTYAIPMVGFVESLNVSVAAAITLHAARSAGCRPADPVDVELLVARFLHGSVRQADRVLAEALGT